MLFYYVQGVYHKNQLGTRLDKGWHDPRSKHNQQKSKRSEHQKKWGVWGHSEPHNQGFRGRSSLRKFLGSKEHLDWLKIDLNVAKIITVQDYKCTKH